MNDLPEPQTEKERRIKEILEHPLETEDDWLHLASLIDADAVSEDGEA